MGHDPTTDPLSDEDLVSRIAAGDAGAFASLFRRRQREVYRFALHMSGTAAVADDVTQEVFLAVMKDAGRYDAARASVAAWLCGIARNHVRRRLDTDRSLVPLDGTAADDDKPDLGATDSDALSDLVRTERIEALRRAVGTLPLRYREVVVLCDLQEMAYSDAAAVLACAVGTVRSRLHRARALLAAKFGMTERVPDPSRPAAKAESDARDPGNVRRGAESGGRLAGVAAARVRYGV